MHPGWLRPGQDKSQSPWDGVTKNTRQRNSINSVSSLPVMPYQIIREKQGTYKRFWGVVTAEEFLASVAKFHSDPEFESIRYTINDFTDCESFYMPSGNILDVAAINLGATRINQKVKIAAVTVDETIIRMADEFAELSQSYPIRIFSTLDDARAWVGNFLFSTS